MRFVVGVDASPHSVAALARAIELAGPLQADVHAVHAVYLPASVAVAMAEASVDTSSVTESAAAATEASIDHLLGMAEVPVTFATVRGYPPDALLEYAEDVGATTIVVGSRGRSELAAFFLGSTGHRVLHYAKCDVLVVKGDE